MTTTLESTVLDKTRELCETIIQQPEFENLRSRIDQFLINDAARAMQDKLKAHIRDLLPNDYLEARKFLESLGWEGQFSAQT